MMTHTHTHTRTRAARPGDVLADGYVTDSAGDMIAGWTVTIIDPLARPEEGIVPDECGHAQCELRVRLATSGCLDSTREDERILAPRLKDPGVRVMSRHLGDWWGDAVCRRCDVRLSECECECECDEDEPRSDWRERVTHETGTNLPRLVESLSARGREACETVREISDRHLASVRAADESLRSIYAQWPVVVSESE